MPLEAPSQAAPSGVAVTASSVSSPSAVPNAPTTTASSVTSPNASVSSPNAVSSVTSPSSSSTPVSSVSSVTPPVSSVKPVGSVTVKPQDTGYFQNGNGQCVYFTYVWNPFGESQCDPSASLALEQAKKDDETAAASGDTDAQGRLLVAEAKNAGAIANQRCKWQSSSSNCDDYVLRVLGSPFYQSLNFQERLSYLRDLQTDMLTSPNVKSDLERQVRFVESHQVKRNSSGEIAGVDRVQVTSSSGGNSISIAAAGIARTIGGDVIRYTLTTVVIAAGLVDLAAIMVGSLTGDTPQRHPCSASPQVWDGLKGQAAEIRSRSTFFGQSIGGGVNANRAVVTFAFGGFVQGEYVSWWGCAISGSINYKICLDNYDVGNMKTNPSKNPYSGSMNPNYQPSNDADARVTNEFTDRYGGQNPTGILYMYIDKKPDRTGYSGACPFCAAHIGALTYENPGVTVCTKDRSGEQWIFAFGMGYRI
jgi:hypothetical protein